MNVKDGLALQMAMKTGYRVIVLSGAYSEPVLQRMQYLGLEDIFLAIKDKRGFLEKYIAEHNLTWEEILFMGDDLPDIPVLKEVTVSCCPADAVNEVKAVCQYISPKKGGQGCVRDVIEKVLKLNNQWFIDVQVASR
jgi:3-deoxy-D-manno-octulosonate 8-phosphate phosphatase (KDO 8-P phosphatase)